MFKTGQLWSETVNYGQNGQLLSKTLNYGQKRSITVKNGQLLSKTVKNASNLEDLPVFRAAGEGDGRMHQSTDERRMRQSTDAKKIAWEGDKVPSHKQSQSVRDRHRDY